MPWDRLNSFRQRIRSSFWIRYTLSLLAIILTLAVVIYTTALKEKLPFPETSDYVIIRRYIIDNWHIVLFVLFSSLATFTAIYQAYKWIFPKRTLPDELAKFVDDGRRAFSEISIKIARLDEIEGDQTRAVISTPTKTATKRPILAHFVDHHVLRIRGLSGPSQALREALIEEAITALALCLLSQRTVLIPAVSFFEGPLRNAIQTYFSTPLATGAISLVGDAQNIDDFLNLRMSEYPAASEPFEIYRRAAQTENDVIHPFVGLPVSSTGQMRVGWQNRIDSLDRIIASHGNSSNLPLLESVPDQLEGRAFVSRHARPILLKNRIQLPENTLTDVLNGIFFDSLSDASDASLIYDLPIIGQPIAARHRAAFSYREMCVAMRVEGLSLSNLIPMIDYFSDDPRVIRLSDTIAKAVYANEAL